MTLDDCRISARRVFPSLRKRVTVSLFLNLAALSVLTPCVARAQNIINTLVGGGNPVPGNAPLAATLGTPAAVTEDINGNIYVSAIEGEYVFKYKGTNISILAGTGPSYFVFP
jgi:hypothetical protein